MDIFSYLLGKKAGGVSPTPPTPILPDTYKMVAYLESDGTQYIDTGYKPNANTKIEIKCSQIRTYGGVVIGAREVDPDNANDIAYAMGTNGGKMTFYYDNLVAIQSTVGTGDFTDVIIENTKVNFNGVDYSNFSISKFPDLNLFLFCINKYGSSSDLCHGKIGTVKIYESNVLVHEFIPCKRKADNVLGFYDTIGEEFYTNDGTGTFYYSEIYI